MRRSFTLSTGTVVALTVAEWEELKDLLGAKIPEAGPEELKRLDDVAP